MGRTDQRALYCAADVRPCPQSPCRSKRVNFGAHPQASPLPAIVLIRISDLEVSRSQGPAGLSDGRIQVDCLCAANMGLPKLLFSPVKKSL